MADPPAEERSFRVEKAPPRAPPGRRPASPPGNPATPVAGHKPKLSPEAQAQEYWLTLYGMAATETLGDGERARIKAHLQAKSRRGEAAEVLCILNFWPAVEKAVAGNAEQKDNYRDLFKALLRMRARSAVRPAAELRAEAKTLAHPSKEPKSLAASAKAAAVDPSLAEESAIIAEILGPLRIAQTGEPPLTEDAIDAYASMACFLYREEHPDRTIDANDNRIIFAKQISDRYIDAPSDKDRRAICNFDLNWAKLKVAWTAGDAAQRRALLSRFTGDTTGKGVANPDPTLDLVLRRGPWASRYAAQK